MSIRNLFTTGIKPDQNLDVNTIECETLIVNQGSTIGDIDAIQVRTDLIVEKTLDAGVNIEGVLLKDSGITIGADPVLPTIDITHVTSFSSLYFNVQEVIFPRFSVTGNMVTVAVPEIIATTAAGVTTELVSSAIPEYLWPAVDIRAPLLVTDNNVNQIDVGELFLDTSGVMHIYRTRALLAWTPSATGGFAHFSFSYSLL